MTYVHPQLGAYSDVFDNIYGAKELPVTAAFGVVDSMDILPYGEPAYEMWYRLLNSGFKITAGAGTDCFTNYRSLHRAPGSSRIYVDTGSTLTWDRWLERYREGRNFATTGPLLTFRVNGEAAGAEIRVPGGHPYMVNVSAEAICRTPLRRLELLQNGRVIETVQSAAGECSLRLNKTLIAEGSCWFAVRAKGDAVRGISPQTATMAHSTPVYLTMDGHPALVAEDLRLMLRWIDRLWALLEERNNFGSAENREGASRTFQQARAHYQEKLRQSGTARDGSVSR